MSAVEISGLLQQLHVKPPSLEQHLELVQFARIRRAKAALRLEAARLEDAEAADAESRAVEACEAFVAGMPVPEPVVP